MSFVNKPYYRCDKAYTYCCFPHLHQNLTTGFHRNIFAIQLLFSNNTLTVKYTSELAYGTYRITSPWANTLIGNALVHFNASNQMAVEEDTTMYISFHILLCLIALFFKKSLKILKILCIHSTKFFYSIFSIHCASTSDHFTITRISRR